MEIKPPTPNYRTLYLGVLALLAKTGSEVEDRQLRALMRWAFDDAEKVIEGLKIHGPIDRGRFTVEFEE